MTKNLDPNKLLAGIKQEVKKEGNNNFKSVDSIVKKIHDADEKKKGVLSSDETKRTSLDIPKELHKRIQYRSIEKDLTIKEYFIGLALKDLEE